MLTLKKQEIPLDHEESDCMFIGQFVATPGAIQEHTQQQILQCLMRVQHLARVHNGIDRLQVFKSDDGKPDLWLIDDGGVVTALLPSDY